MNAYKRHRFPSDINFYAVWLFDTFKLSHRDIEDWLAERGITVSYEAIRLWCIKSGTLYTRRLKHDHGGYGNTLYIDEVFARNNCKQHYLWRVVDQDGEVVPAAMHGTDRYTNNRAEQSHAVTRLRDRGMRKFKSSKQAQRILSAQAVQNRFKLGRHKAGAERYRDIRLSAFEEWSRAVA